MNTFLLTLFLLLSAFFSSAETAFTALNRFKIKHLFKQYPEKGILIEKICTRPQRLLTAILIGNNIANVALATVATTFLLDLFKQYGFHHLGASMTLITLIITITILIFGEITPKTLTLKNPEKYAIKIAPFLFYFLLSFTPIIWIFEGVTKLIGKIFGIHETMSRNQMTLEELKTIIDMSREDGVLEQEKKEMLRNVFDLSETISREIMTPRTDTICIKTDKKVQDAIHLIMEKGHSRIPVFEDKVDNIQGIIYAKDLLGISEEARQHSIKKYMRKAIFIPESKPIEALFQQMKASKSHLAIVVDEYGGMAGIVTLEDIIEEILGEIQDEYDINEKKEFIRINDNTFLVKATINIKDLSEKLSLTFPSNDDYDTLGGFILSQCGKLPEKNDTISYDNYEFRITEIKKRRIIDIEIKKPTT